MLDLYCYTQACSSCNKWRLLSCYGAWGFHCGMQNASHCILFLQSMGCRYAGFSSCSAMGLATLWHVESSQTRDPSHVCYVGSQILNHWAIREGQDSVDATSVSTYLTQRWYDCSLFVPGSTIYMSLLWFWLLPIKPGTLWWQDCWCIYLAI